MCAAASWTISFSTIRDSSAGATSLTFTFGIVTMNVEPFPRVDVMVISPLIAFTS